MEDGTEQKASMAERCGGQRRTQLSRGLLAPEHATRKAAGKVVSCCIWGREEQGRGLAAGHGNGSAHGAMVPMRYLAAYFLRNCEARGAMAVGVALLLAAGAGSLARREACGARCAGAPRAGGRRGTAASRRRPRRARAPCGRRGGRAGTW